MRFEICRYCGGEIKAVPAESVYGKTAKRRGLEGEYLCQCQNCGARVGCHKGTQKPLGKVANEILRLKRIEAHRVFDGYWKSQRMSRTDAYRWLSQRLRVPVREAHIGGFEMDQCQRVMELCGAESEEAA